MPDVYKRQALTPVVISSISLIRLGSIGPTDVTDSIKYSQMCIRDRFDTVQAIQLRFSQPNKKKRDYPLKGKAFCGCCGHALSRTMQKTSY